MTVCLCLCAGVRALSLRVLREMLKTEASRLHDFAELTTMKVLGAFADSEASVSGRHQGRGRGKSALTVPPLTFAPR